MIFIVFRSPPWQSIQDGEPSQVAQHLLPAPQVQVPQEVQGDPVQEVSRVQAGSGKEEVKPKAFTK